MCGFRSAMMPVAVAACLVAWAAHTLPTVGQEPSQQIVFVPKKPYEDPKFQEAPTIQAALALARPGFWILVNQDRPAGFLATDVEDVHIFGFAAQAGQRAVITGNVGLTGCRNVYVHGGGSDLTGPIIINQCQDCGVSAMRASGGAFVANSKDIRFEDIRFEGTDASGVFVRDCPEQEQLDAQTRVWRQQHEFGRPAVDILKCSFQKLTGVGVHTWRSHVRVHGCEFRDLDARGVLFDRQSLGWVQLSPFRNVTGTGILYFLSEGMVIASPIIGVRPIQGNGCGIEVQCPTVGPGEPVPRVHLVEHPGSVPSPKPFAAISDCPTAGILVFGGGGFIDGHVGNCPVGIAVIGFQGQISGSVERASLVGIGILRCPQGVSVVSSKAYTLPVQLMLNSGTSLLVSDSKKVLLGDVLIGPHRFYGPDPAAVNPTRVGGVRIFDSEVELGGPQHFFNVTYARDEGVFAWKSHLKGSMTSHHSRLAGVVLDRSQFEGRLSCIANRGVGLQLTNEATAELEEPIFERNLQGEILVDEGSTLTVQKGLFTGPYMTPEGSFVGTFFSPQENLAGTQYCPFAIKAAGRSKVTARDTWIWAHAQSGLWLTGGSTAELRACDLFAARYWEVKPGDESAVNGVRVEDGCSLDARGCRFVSTAAAGICMDAGGTARVAESKFVGWYRGGTYGVYVLPQGSADLQGNTFENSVDHPIYRIRGGEVTAGGNRNQSGAEPVIETAERAGNIPGGP